MPQVRGPSARDRFSVLPTVIFKAGGTHKQTDNTRTHTNTHKQTHKQEPYEMKTYRVLTEHLQRGSWSSVSGLSIQRVNLLLGLVDHDH